MKNNETKNLNILSTAVIGCMIIAIILTAGTFSLGRTADHDTKEAVRNVSLLYLSELATRREQVVSQILDEYTNDIDIALGLLSSEDLSSTENLQAYQSRMKQLYGLDKFAFVDTQGTIYTSRGTRSDIDDYGIDYMNLTDTVVRIKNLKSSDKKVILAVPTDNLQFEGHTLVVCFMEIDMDNLLKDASLQSNNNTTFCNIYTPDGIALTDMVLGGLASEDNLLGAMEHADYEAGYNYEKLKEDFESGVSGVVSFSYNGISETLYYVPVHSTDWMLTYLIRESIIGEQINSISDSIIRRSLVQSVLTAGVLIVMFTLLFIQQRRASKATIDKEVMETENRVRQQELEEQLAMQEELASKSEELSKALEAAEDASRAKSSFVSNMSHEIRTPITAILGMNEMIRRETTDPGIIPYADNIDKAGASLLGIISDILDFSKIEAGGMELTDSDYSLPVMLSDLYNLIQFRAEAKGLELKIITDPTLPKGLFGDELRIKQIITNLLSNAVKYTEKGSICLEVKRLEADDEHSRIKLSVAVTDTGIGIRKEEMEKLFTPFDRLDLSRTRSIEGSGLGLSITRQLLGMMDSQLEVESEYNKGSVFRFDIWQGVSDPGSIGDFDPADITLGTEQKAHDRKYFTAPGRRLLVVDDMPMNLQVLKGLLKRTQMIIETASSGEECIRMFGSNDYDMVFLDYRMPGLDGIDTILQLKKLYPDKVSVTPIISLTASAIAGDRERLLNAGFNDYLSKPVNIPELESVMEKYLGSPTDVVVPDEPEIPGDTDMTDIPDIPQCIRDIDALDIAKGLEYCGDAEDYIFALETYAESVDEKAEQILRCLEDKNYEEFALLTHSLKSMSKSIGALRLSEQAAELEKLCKERALDQVLTGTLAFLKEYRDLGTQMVVTVYE